MAENICILGSTGSIGCSTLQVIENNRDRFSVTVLTANKNYQKLFEQCQKFEPELAVMACPEAAEKLSGLLSSKNLQTTVTSGVEAIIGAAEYENIDILVASIVGAAGLLPTMAGVRKGLRILLANKEALVMSGELFTSAVRKHGATLLPVDSEHNAIFQSLPIADSNGKPDLNGVNQILLTGSGGPFLNEPLESLQDKSPDQACAHPNWDMGRKISVDSATMMNKGLELIEACFLFNVTIDQITVVVHPQSIIHSMVSYLDGSVIAQLGNPDMKTPIAHCLAWPERIDAGVKPLDFFNLAALEFQPPEFERFPCLELAIAAIKEGKSAPCVLNAANEVAVEAFLNQQINFGQIAKVIQQTMQQTQFETLNNFEQVIATDQLAREKALATIKRMTTA